MQPFFPFWVRIIEGTKRRRLSLAVFYLEKEMPSVLTEDICLSLWTHHVYKLISILQYQGEK